MGGFIASFEGLRRYFRKKDNHLDVSRVTHDKAYNARNESMQLDLEHTVQGISYKEKALQFADLDLSSFVFKSIEAASDDNAYAFPRQGKDLQDTCHGKNSLYDVEVSLEKQPEKETNENSNMLCKHSLPEEEPYIKYSAHFRGELADTFENIVVVGKPSKKTSIVPYKVEYSPRTVWENIDDLYADGCKGMISMKVRAEYPQLKPLGRVTQKGIITIEIANCLKEEERPEGRQANEYDTPLRYDWDNRNNGNGENRNNGNGDSSLYPDNDTNWRLSGNSLKSIRYDDREVN